MKILISAAPCGILEFYEQVAREIGYTSPSEIEYDCTKINIAENIQDGFYEYYTQIARETDLVLSESDIRTGITIRLAMSGPKVDPTLKANEVEIFDGFIIETIQN